MIEPMTIEQRVDAANARVLEIMTKGRPVWVDVRPAIDVIPGMTKTTILTPGPGIDPDRVHRPSGLPSAARSSMKDLQTPWRKHGAWWSAGKFSLYPPRP